MTHLQWREEINDGFLAQISAVLGEPTGLVLSMVCNISDNHQKLPLGHESREVQNDRMVVLSNQLRSLGDILHEKAAIHAATACQTSPGASFGTHPVSGAEPAIEVGPAEVLDPAAGTQWTEGVALADLLLSPQDAQMNQVSATQSTGEVVANADDQRLAARHPLRGQQTSPRRRRQRRS